MFCEVLDGCIHEVLQPRRNFFTLVFEIVEKLKEFAYILLAIGIAVRLVEKLQSLDKDLQALLNDCTLHYFMAEEFLKDLD